MKVKTSVAIDEEVLSALKDRAKQERRSVSSMIEFELSKIFGIVHTAVTEPETQPEEARP